MATTVDMSIAGLKAHCMEIRRAKRDSTSATHGRKSIISPADPCAVTDIPANEKDRDLGDR
eukprot:6404131-Pyramimonas_sp.AAC.1